MRFSPLVKNIFIDGKPVIKIIRQKEFDKQVKTKKVLVDVDVIAKAFTFFAGKGHLEGAGLLRGKISGEYLLIKDIFCCENAESTTTNVKMKPENFSKATSIKDGNYVVGWSHSHPGFEVFMSPKDKSTQLNFQAMFPDAVSLVMNPFGKDGIDFKFFRYKDDNLEKIKYDFLVSRDEQT